MYRKVERDEIQHFLDITPTAQKPTFALIGVGVTDYGISYGASKTSEKWIIHRNKHKSLDSYDVSGAVNQTCYYGDEVYDYVNNLRRRLATGDKAKSHILDIDIYDYVKEENTITYKATLFDCIVEITNYAEGENPKISYNVNYDGDPKIGTVVFTGGKPVFTEENNSIEDEN